MLFGNYDLNVLVSSEHELRKVNETVDFVKIARKFVELKTALGRRGDGLEIGIKCLFLQFFL